MAAGGLDAKTIAVLGVLAAMGGALRVLSAGTAGLEPMFFLLVLAGRVLGRGMGFVLGALAIVTGAFLTGGVGPVDAVPDDHRRLGRDGCRDAAPGLRPCGAGDAGGVRAASPGWSTAP